MGYNTERVAIQNWLQGQSPAFFGLDPFGLDGSPEKLADNSGFLSIINGAGKMLSRGSPGSNLHGYVGLLKITIVTPLDDGARLGKIYADQIIDSLTALKLDETGAPVGPGATTVIDFGWNDMVPHLNFAAPESPFYRTVVDAPFMRLERK